MNLFDYARQLLTSPKLEDKLLPPPRASEESWLLLPSAAKDLVTQPARPENFSFGGGNSFPSLEKMAGDPTERAKVFLFFLNHEILAIELMALALLRFQDQPRAFLQGIVDTIAEEQQHCRLYLDAIERLCPGQNLSIGCSRFFWDALKDMNKPQQYIAGLSLTFEQANLDFASHFGNIMQNCGDAESSALLQRVYREEIGHVKFGCIWMQKFEQEIPLGKNQRHSLWHSYLQHLNYPLTPQRGKSSFNFDLSGRQAAGLDSEFIQQMKIHSFSRGRMPRLFIYNNYAEEEAALGQAGWRMGGVTRDLSLLCAPLLGEEDIILIDKSPTSEYLEKLYDAGLTKLPAIMNKQEVRESVKKFPLAEISQWAPAPLPQALQNFLTKERRNKQPTPSLCARLYQRRLHWQVFSEFIYEYQKKNKLSSNQDIELAMPIETDDDLIIIPEEWSELAFKSDSSCSGRGLTLLYHNEEGLEILLKKAMESKGILERKRNIEQEFSMQFKLDAKGKVQYQGLSIVISNEFGKYRGNIAGRIMKDFTSEQLQLLHAENGGIKLIENFAKYFAKYCQQHNLPLKEFGIDAYFHRDEEGKLWLRPFSEVNPRLTMGALALAWHKRYCAANTRVFLQQIPLRGLTEFIDDPSGEVDAQGRFTKAYLPLQKKLRCSLFIPIVEVT